MALPGTSDLDEYGGELSDYRAVTDPTTDRSASATNQALSDVAGMTHTASRAWVAFVGKASSPPDDPASNIHGAVWGDGASVKPTMARTGAGIFTATWATTITDELGETQSVSLRRAHGWAEGAVHYSVQARVTAANVVTINVADMAGTASDAVGVTIVVQAF